MPAKAGKKDSSKQGGGHGVGELERTKGLILDRAKEVGSPHLAQILGEAQQELSLLDSHPLSTANPSPYLNAALS
jgi:hypothetical protein